MSNKYCLYNERVLNSFNYMILFFLSNYYMSSSTFIRNFSNGDGTVCVSSNLGIFSKCPHLHADTFPIVLAMMLCLQNRSRIVWSDRSVNITDLSTIPKLLHLYI